MARGKHRGSMLNGVEKYSREGSLDYAIIFLLFISIYIFLYLVWLDLNCWSGAIVCS